MDISNVGKHIGTSLFGLAIVGGSWYGEWVALHQRPLDTKLIIIFLISSTVGAGLVVPDPLYKNAQKAIDLYKQWKNGTPPAA